MTMIPNICSRDSEKHEVGEMAYSVVILWNKWV